MARAALREPAPRVTLVLSLTVEKVDSNWVCSSQVHPVLDGEVVKGEQHVELVSDLGRRLGELCGGVCVVLGCLNGGGPGLGVVDGLYG